MRTYSLSRALPPQPLNLAIPIHLVVLEHGQFRLLALMLDFLGRGVDLLFALLGHASTESQHQVKGGLLLEVVVAERAAVFQLLAREDQALLVRGDALFVCCARGGLDGGAVGEGRRGRWRYPGSWT